MPPRPFVPWLSPVLRRPAAPVGQLTDEDRATWDDLIATMLSQPTLVGLAAPQIGVARALAVVDCSPGRDAPIRLADPVLVAASDRIAVTEEGSPNLPGLSAPIPRPDAVTIAFTEPGGTRTERRFEGLWAASVQHQIDHLEGRMYFDRLSRLKRDRLLKRARRKG